MLSAYKFIKIGDTFFGDVHEIAFMCVTVWHFWKKRVCVGDICAVSHRVYHLQSCSSLIVSIFT